METKSIIVFLVAERKYHMKAEEEFAESKPGRLMRDPGGFVAFVPDPLPPSDLPLDWELAMRLSNADRALSELAGIARTLPNPRLLTRPFVRREAVLSSRIEGTQASASDVALHEAGRPADAMPDAGEVRNYARALDYGLERMNDLPFSLRLIREIHRELMTGVGRHLTPGEFRRTQNWIGPPGCTLADATYVPPPVAEMTERLADLERYVHTRSTLPPLVRLALIHYEFEALHPFLDGNGRVGRLLIALLLCAEGLLAQPMLYLSAYFERNRAAYYEHLLEVSRRGAWREWIVFFLQGVTEESGDAVRRAAQLLDLWRRYRGIAKASAYQLRLVDELFSRPAMNVAQVGQALGITHRAAQMNVDKLVAAGVLREATGRRRDRIFIAPDIVALIDAAEAPRPAGASAFRPGADAFAGKP